MYFNSLIFTQQTQHKSAEMYVYDHNYNIMCIMWIDYLKFWKF
jgi:hypothetical protein